MILLWGRCKWVKAYFFDIINALLGNENVGYSLESLTDKEGYFRAMIVNKLLNYASELNANQASIRQNKTRLISGEKMQARLPYGQPFNMTITQN